MLVGLKSDIQELILTFVALLCLSNSTAVNILKEINQQIKIVIVSHKINYVYPRQHVCGNSCPPGRVLFV